MSKPEYEKKGSEIIRLKDGKVVANIDPHTESGPIKVVPVAPVFFKAEIFAKILSAAGVSPKEPDLDEPEPTHAEVFAVEIEAIHKEEGFLGLAEVILSLILEAKQEIPASGTIPFVEAPPAIDFSDAPKCDPMKGDRTPEFMAWFKKNHPEAAAERYGK